MNNTPLADLADAEPDTHADDMSDPVHGSDMDPCAVCDPYGYDLAVASILDTLRNNA